MENSYYNNTNPCSPFGDFQSRGGGSASTARPCPQHAAFLTSPPPRGQFTEPRIPTGPRLSHGQVYDSNYGSSNAFGQAPFQSSQQFGRLSPIRPPAAQFQRPAGSSVGDFPRTSISVNVNVPPPLVNVNMPPPLPQPPPVNRSIPPPGFNPQVPPPSVFNPHVPPPAVRPSANAGAFARGPMVLPPAPPSSYTSWTPASDTREQRPRIPPPVVRPPTSAGAFVCRPMVLPPAPPASSYTSWSLVADTREKRPRIPRPAMFSYVNSQRMSLDNALEHPSAQLSIRDAFSSDGRLLDLSSVPSSTARMCESSVTIVSKCSMPLSSSAADHISHSSAEGAAVVTATTESRVTSRRRRRPATRTNITVSCSCTVHYQYNFMTIFL